MESPRLRIPQKTTMPYVLSPFKDGKVVKIRRALASEAKSVGMKNKNKPSARTVSKAMKQLNATTMKQGKAMKTSKAMKTGQAMKTGKAMKKGSAKKP